MIHCDGILENIVIAILCIFTLVLLVCWVRAIQGPRYTDRLIALNMICTVVILMICLLSYWMNAFYMIDVAILYGLLNLLAIIVLSRISIRRYRGRKEQKK